METINPLFEDLSIDNDMIFEDEPNPNSIEDEDDCPIIQLPKTENRRIRSSCKNAIIVQLFDRWLSYEV